MPQQYLPVLAVARKNRPSIYLPVFEEVDGESLQIGTVAEYLVFKHDSFHIARISLQCSADVVQTC